MRLVLITGSRNPEGQTARAANAIVDGVQSAGGEVEQVYLPLLDLERCRQCDDTGWGICRKEGTCIIEDDFAELVQKVKGADAAVFATPVYWGDLSESMRSFTDRLRRICTVPDARAGIEGKPAVGICVAGGGGGGSLTCCISLEKVLNTCGFNVLDMVPVRRQNLKAKLNCLRLTGAWMVSATRIRPAP